MRCVLAHFRLIVRVFIHAFVERVRFHVENLRAGKVNCVVECNPNAGWYVRNTIKRYLNGNTIPDEIYMPETVFSDKGNLDSIPPREY